ncbi:glycoside hydrolase family 57 protein [Parabacteroides pacaensis]|uniref:glycoside hydrolase family 57 protein n=1 Tax=Parabacteroides pacaensis TaxID=2086575 RepID=UPI000D10274F|nr:glycoside hydrolase family 57 protein [Parabacteroides pacaensis]
MKTICLTFRIHQPYRLKRYRFSEIGNDHYYYDDFFNEDVIRNMAQRCYLPANRLLMEMIRNSGKRFKVAFDISGVILEQFEIYAPEVIDSLKELAATGNVEFLGSTFSHSLSSLFNEEEFAIQVKAHAYKINTLFNVEPRVFCNTGLIYSEEIAPAIANLGFDGVLTEGAASALGWKSPDYLYKSSSTPALKLLFRHAGLSEDIAVRFNNYDWSEYPLTAGKYTSWIARIPEQEQLINLRMNYETIGGIYKEDTGIFDFFRTLPEQAAQRGIGFSTPSEIIKLLKPVDSISVATPISSEGNKDLSSWLNNALQQEAFNKIGELGKKITSPSARRLIQDWFYLQSADHLYYMGDQFIGKYGSYPYETPFAAFGNYMNVLSDFAARINAQFPSDEENEEQNPLLATIRRQEKEIDELEKELKKYQKNK